MLRTQAFLTFSILAVASAASFSGASALNYTRQAVAFGPRPPGSEANRKLQAYILSQVKLDGCEVIEDAFVAKTPKGDISMKNIIARFTAVELHLAEYVCL